MHTTRARRWLLGAAVGLSLAAGLAASGVRPALAQHDGHNHGTPPGHGTPAAGHGTPAAGHGAPGAHGDGHGDGHHGPGQINWIYGLIGTKDDLKEPDLLFRPKGMPVPFLANLINFGVVLGLLFKFAGPKVKTGLSERRTELSRDIEAAAETLAAARERHDAQKAREDKLEEEIAQIKVDYAAQSKSESERITREAKERHDRLVREARQLLQQEGNALKQRLLLQTIETATAEAEATLRSQVTSADQERLANEYLAQLGSFKMQRGEA